MASKRPGTVLIAEDIDPEDIYVLSGLFSAHWESEDESESLEGPEGVTAEEAIEWGRRHADVVLIRLGDSDEYSAAGSPPRVTRRRVRGMEHLDLVTDAAIDWRVRLPRRVSRRHPEHDMEQLRQSLAADEAVGGAAADLKVGSERVDAIFRFVVRARSHADALKVVLAVEERVGVPYPVEELPRAPDGAWLLDPGWNPMDDIRPA